MWIIGMAICVALMLAGHSAMNRGHGSHSQEPAAREPASIAAAPDGVAGEGAPERAPRPASGSHH